MYKLQGTSFLGTYKENRHRPCNPIKVDVLAKNVFVIQECYTVTHSYHRPRFTITARICNRRDRKSRNNGYHAVFTSDLPVVWSYGTVTRCLLRFFFSRSQFDPPRAGLGVKVEHRQRNFRRKWGFHFLGQASKFVWVLKVCISYFEVIDHCG